MADGSINLPVTPDFNKPAVHTSRRNSTGKLGSSNRGGEVLPRYLRASTGSCHDFCKHGKKLAVEDKSRNPMPKRIAAKPRGVKNSLERLNLSQKRGSSAVKLESSSNFRNHGLGMSNQEMSVKSSLTINPRKDEAPLEKKTSAVKLKSSLNSLPDATKPLKHGQLSNSLRQGELFSAGKVRISLKEASSNVKGKSLSRNNSALLKLKSPTKKKISSLSSSSPPLEGLSAKGVSGTSERKNGKRAVTSKVATRKILESPRASSSLRPAVHGSASLPSRKHISLKLASSLKIHNETEKAGEQSNNGLKESSNDELQEKTLYVIKMEEEHKILESFENENGAVELSSPQSSSLEFDKNENSAVELSAPQPLCPKSDSIKAEEENKKLKREERENCIIESSLPTSSSLESSSIPVSPSLSYHSEGAEDDEESDHTESEVEYDSLSECSETMNMEEAGMLEGEEKAPDNNSQPEKLCFRRGKVVDIQSESDCPRRLKFRRGRVLSENQNVKSEGHKSFRRREVVSDTNVNRPSEEKVVLRHQDKQGKKDAQMLLNNVIEETAIKLVESRKSKVKALVGAFETVILLQESKPSSDIVTANELVS